MIKKIILFIIVTVITFPLFAKTSVNWSFDEKNDELQEFERKLVKYLDNLGYEEEVDFLSYSNSILTLSLFDKEYRAPITKGYVDEAIDSILLYNEAFDSKSDEKIDYFYQKTFSSTAPLKRGSLYYALNKDGKKQALMVVDKNNPASTLLGLYSKKLVTGLELKKASPYVISIATGLIFSPKFILNGDITLKNQSLLYPFNPAIKLKVVSNAYNTTSYLGGVGVSTCLPLSTFYPRAISLLRNTSIVAEAFIYIGYNKKVVYSAGWDIYLSNMLNEHFGFTVGIEKTIAFNKDSKYALLENTELKLGVVIR